MSLLLLKRLVRYLNIKTVPVLIGALGLVAVNTGNANAALGTELQMTIVPLKCTIEVVDDGLRRRAYIDSGPCQKMISSKGRGFLLIHPTAYNQQTLKHSLAQFIDISTI